MIQEFEGRTEQEAIDLASDMLGVAPDQFEVELLEEKKSGIFSRNKMVRIRVHTQEKPVMRRAGSEEPETDFEHALVEFVARLTEKMGYPADVKIAYRETSKVGFRLMSEHSRILIGRKGKNLDAIQVLANVVAGRFEDDPPKVVIDTEGYRGRREENLIRLAQRIGDQVKRTRKSKLLEPMNPFERRLIHTTLNDVEDIGTESEGEGLYKQVRIFYRGGQR